MLVPWELVKKQSSRILDIILEELGSGGNNVEQIIYLQESSSVFCVELLRSPQISNREASRPTFGGSGGGAPQRKSVQTLTLSSELWQV